MSKSLRLIVTILLSAAIFVAVPLSIYGGKSVYADGEIYYIHGIQYIQNIRNEDESVADEGYGFCIDKDMNAPHWGQGDAFTRGLLSDSGIDAQTELLIRSYAYNLNSIFSYISGQKANNTFADMYYKYYDFHNNTAEVYQDLIWDLIDAAGGKTNASARYDRIYQLSRVMGNPDDYYNGDKSQCEADWQPFFEDFMTWLQDNAPSNDYDCYIYYSEDDTVQRIVGSAYPNLIVPEDQTTPSESSESSETAESSSESSAETTAETTDVTTTESSSESSAETTAETTDVTTTESASDETTVTSASLTDGGSSGGGTATVETTAASETSQTVQSVETTVPTETSVSTGSDTDIDSGNRGGDSDSSVPDTGESTSLSVYIGLGMMVASLPVLGESIKRRRSYRR